MSPAPEFLDVRHETIVEKQPPYFQGDELHVEVKVRNLLPESVRRTFCYIMAFQGGYVIRGKTFDLGPNETQTHSLGPPYYLGFLGNFSIHLLTGDAGRRYHEEEGKTQIPAGYGYQTLFTGNSLDRQGYELQARTAEAVDMMREGIDAMREGIDAIKGSTESISKADKRLFYLTIAIAVFAVLELVTLIYPLVIALI